MKRNMYGKDVIAGYDFGPLFRVAEKYPLLSREDEHDLANRAFYGDRQASDTLLFSNLRYAIHLAHKLVGTRTKMPIEDAVQCATIGLMIAIKKFEPSRGTRLTTYATHWIRQCINNEMLNYYPIRVPNYLFKPGKQANASAKSKALIEKALLALKAANEASMMQIEDNRGQLRNFDLSEVVADRSPGPCDEVPDREQSEADADRLRGWFFQSLDNRSMSIISKRFNLDGHGRRTLSAIGEFEGISKERVRQIERDALRSMRRAARARA